MVILDGLHLLVVSFVFVSVDRGPSLFCPVFGGNLHMGDEELESFLNAACSSENWRSIVLIPIPGHIRDCQTPIGPGARDVFRLYSSRFSQRTVRKTSRKFAKTPMNQANMLFFPFNPPSPPLLSVNHHRNFLETIEIFA